MNITSNYASAASSAWSTQGSGAAGGAGKGQGFADFKSLSAALNSGNLNDAKTAFAALQKDMQNAPTQNGKSPFDPSSQMGQDFAAIGKALQSGDVAGAKQALQTFRQDMHGAQKAHHHHHQDADGDGDGSGTTVQSPTVATTTASSGITNSGFSATA